MKRFLSVFLFTFLSIAVSAQQDAQFSQNMFNKLAINPAFAGAYNSICASLLGRQQWVKFTNSGGTPQTYLLNFDAPVSLLHGGVGFNILQDKIGRENTMSVNAAYAFRLPLGPGTFSAGLTLGMLNKQINSSGWVTPDLDPALDPAIPSDNVNKIVFDMGLGVYYNIGTRLFLGVSTTHLPASAVKISGSSAEKDTAFNWDTKRHYYIMSGYTYPLGGSVIWDLRPSIFVKTDGTSAQVDFNCNIMYNKTFWGGIAYRYKDAVVPTVGFQQASGLRVGIAYDVTTSDLKNGAKGGRTSTFELMLGYCFKRPEKVSIQKKKNVRFL